MMETKRRRLKIASCIMDEALHARAVGHPPMHELLGMKSLDRMLATNTHLFIHAFIKHMACPKVRYVWS